MLINFDKNGLGKILGDFSQTHLVTLERNDTKFCFKLLPQHSLPAAASCQCDQIGRNFAIWEKINLHF
jgi:hypothetical protein